MRKPSISCVIPAYNEAARIQKVLDVAVTYPKFTEVIVVNDGSTDSTEEVVREYKNVKIISFKQNRGKAAAVITAIKKSKGSIIVLLDADLEGLHFENLDRLIRPVEKEECIAVSLRANSPFYWKGIGIDPASGERAFRKNFSERFTSDFLESKYAFELKFK
jgi:glycosyltransferase involved in cell wall biosynthesis